MHGSLLSKYFIFSAFQVHEHLDNGSLIFLIKLALGLQPYESFVAATLFALQSRFFPNFPNDGPTLFVITEVTCTMTYITIRFLKLLFAIVTIICKILVCILRDSRKHFLSFIKSVDYNF